jgi:hypothetical protein
MSGKIDLPKAWEPFVKKTYVIASDEYMGMGQDIWSETCTWRELLLKLNGVEPDDTGTCEDVLVCSEAEEGDLDYDKTFKDVTDEELVKTFDNANGDGQPYVMVWCVEDGKKVLG